MLIKHLSYPAGYFAKGRLRAGEMNRTEQSYAEFLEKQKQRGYVADYWFECLKLQVAKGQCWYTPDFLVLKSDGELQLHEVKGTPRLFQDDAKVKCKAVASKYPFALFVAYPRAKKDGGGWDVFPYP